VKIQDAGEILMHQWLCAV